MGSHLTSNRTDHVDDAHRTVTGQVSEVAARLRAMRTDTARRIAAMTGELEAVAAASASSNIDDEHDPEGSTIAFEREQLAALRAQAAQHLVDVDDALTRLAHGTYGVCERCGAAIGAARLEALPAARLCVRCAAART